MWTVRRQWQVLIALGLVACVANLFGPAERWWGVDIGATGAAVFYLCLVALLGLMALKGSDAFPETWSLAERRAWVGMGFSALIFGATAKFLWASSHREIVPTRLFEVPARDLVSFVIVMAIAWGMAGHVLGRGAGPVEHDERDLRMRFQADRIGDWALRLTVVGSVLLLTTVPASGLAVFPKSGHTLNLEEPALFNQLLAEFIAQVEAGRWGPRDPRANPAQIMRTE